MIKKLAWFVDKKGKRAQKVFNGEKGLREHILPSLDLGRVNWDRPHTEAVVFWVKELLRFYPQLNAKVLITAAYAHDWGYGGLFGLDTGDDLDQIYESKKDHMRLGAKKIGKLLRNKELRGFYTEKEIKKIEHLVLVHDNFEKLRTDEELLLMEADTLGMLDTDLIEPTLSAEDNEIFIRKELLGQRRVLFKHKEAIKAFEEALKKRRAFYSTKR